MKKFGLVFAAVLAVAIVAGAPSANAQTVHYIGAGSSAMFQGFGVAAVNDLGNSIATGTAAAPYNYCASGSGNTCTVNHWSAASGSSIAGATDSRAAGIPTEFGNIWVAWVNCTGTSCPSYTGTDGATEVWTYLSIDSTVGVRNFLGRNSLGNPSTLTLTAAAETTNGANEINPALFIAPWNVSEASDGGLQGDVYTALSGAFLTAGMTDIRPEDALYATYRILGDCPAAGCGNSSPTPPSNPCSPSDVGVPGVPAPLCATTTFSEPYFYSFSLGYGGLPGPGTQILEAVMPGGGASGTAKTTPVGFALPGFKDPFNPTVTVPTTIEVFPVGETPIVMLVNRGNANGFGQIIGSFPKCAASGPWNTVCTENAAFNTDDSYYVRNVWDQHPYPPVASTFPSTTAPTVGYCATNPTSAFCHITRRPLGNLFAGNLCEGRNTAFSWPLDPALEGARTTVPNGTDFPINVVLREPLSGTYNTFEFDEVRRFGAPSGNQTKSGSTFGKPPYISQESNIEQNESAKADTNPLALTCVAGFEDTDKEGLRYRAIGTGDVVKDVKANEDTIGYAFFSFGNVSSIATSETYGYLMIDGIDPLFADYENNAGNPGQPASPSSPKTWGELPACTPNGTPDCKRNAIWASGNYYPHLVDGTYPAWSEVRMICDTASPNCLASSDAMGAEALVQNLQFDIHNNNPGGSPDLLPFSDAASGALSFNPPYGDVAFIRDHFSYLQADDTQNYNNGPNAAYNNANQQTTHQALLNATSTSLGLSAAVCSGKVGVNGPPSSECGGDAGGFVVATGTANQGGKLQ
jgi:hypothetical protein